MKIIYDSFQELAGICTKGESVFHGVYFNKHDQDPCIAWQHGVQQFAEMLDRYVEFPEEGVVLKDCFKDYSTQIKINGR